MVAPEDRALVKNMRDDLVVECGHSEFLILGKVSEAVWLFDLIRCLGTFGCAEERQREMCRISEQI
jgi:hypothetical protein